MRGGASVATLSTARLHTLFGEKKARVELMSHHRSSAFIDHLNKTIILLIETIDDVRGEFGVGERLPNGCHRISERLDLVVVGCGRLIKFLTITKGATKGADTGLRLRRKRALKDSPRLMGGLGEDNQPGHRRCERALDSREDSLILTRPDTMRRIVIRAIDAVHKRRRTGQRAVNVAEEVMTPKEGLDLRMPEDVVLRR
jgi:hypothetical protein